MTEVCWLSLNIFEKCGAPAALPCMFPIPTDGDPPCSEVVPKLEVFQDEALFPSDDTQRIVLCEFNWPNPSGSSSSASEINP